MTSSTSVQIPSTAEAKPLTWAQIRPNVSGYDPYGDPASKYVPLPALPTATPEPVAEADSDADNTGKGRRFRFSMPGKAKKD